MFSAAKEPIVSRLTRLNQLILGKKNPDWHVLHHDGLLDALLLLYDECNNRHMRRDANISTFVDKVRPIVAEIQALRVKLSDFDVKKIIGRGNFGEVRVVREKATGDVYAMKTLRKAETLSHQCVAFYDEERDIMAKCSSPWITKLQYAFQDSQHLYLVMEFHPGGDMLSLLERYECLTEEKARFYLAELALAIHAVHTMGYAHRDIKPDNILLDRTGHIKLADFGSAAKLNSLKLVTSKMPVGTPDYIAPEVLSSANDKAFSKTGYSVACDWWSFGIVAFEMLTGQTPFAEEKFLLVYNNIMNFKKSLKFPEEISETFKDLIRSLLRDANERFGYNDLVAHDVFQELDWNNMLHTAPPFVPNVCGQDDTSNFDHFEQENRPCLSELQTEKNFSGKNLPFIGFTYVAQLEPTHKRYSSTGDTLDSPCKSSASDKRSVVELQNKVAELTTENESLKNSLNKVKATLTKEEDMHESEIFRLEGEISSLTTEKKELLRLLQMERDVRVLTDKKTSQILRCMKMRKGKAGQNILIERLDENIDEDTTLVNLLEDMPSKLESDEEKENLLKVHDRSKSVSPYFSRNVGKASTEMAALQKDLQKVKKEKNDAVEQIKVLKKAVSTLEQDLFDAEEKYQNQIMSPSKTDSNASMVTCHSDKHDELLVVKVKLLEQAQKDLADVKDKLQVYESELNLVSTSKKNVEKILAMAQKENYNLKQCLQSLSKGTDSLSFDQHSVNETSWETIEQLSSATSIQLDSFHSCNSIGSMVDAGSQADLSDVSQKQKIEQLESEIAILKSQPKESDVDYKKLLKERDSELSEAKLDLRIASREKKRVEDMSTAFRESNRELRDQLENAESVITEKTKAEKQLTEKVKALEKEIGVKNSDIMEKVKLYESQKDINQLFVKNQDQYEEIMKQNEKLKEDKRNLEKKNSDIRSELETVRENLKQKEQDCAKNERVLAILKTASKELEAELKDFEFLEKCHEEDMQKVTDEKQILADEMKKLENDFEKLSIDYAAVKQAKEKFEADVEDLEDELEQQQSVSDAELQALQEQVSHEKKIAAELEAQLLEMEKDISSCDNDNKSQSRRNAILTTELIEIKEEAAKLISQVSSLKASNLKLTQSLEEMTEKESEALFQIEQLHNNLENAMVTNNHERLKLHETINQQIKLIDFLQNKTESMEKKKKPALSVPRLFGKKDNSSSSSWNDRDVLAEERMKCRRLQDQLSQARYEIMVLRDQLKDKTPRTPVMSRITPSVPMSPMSKAMHTALTSSPTTSDGSDTPTQDSSVKFAKPQGMKHKIPHRFSEVMCMKSFKCAACLDSIHFGRFASKCQECSVICHSKCASSLPSTCGLPSGFVQHFKSTVSRHPTIKVTSEESLTPEGWIKVPKSNKQGWERKYIRIDGSVLYLYDNSETKDPAESTETLDFGTEEGAIIVVSGVSGAELSAIAQSDLPFVLKVEYRPFTTCWPSRSLYLMAENFTVKQLWVGTLEALADRYNTATEENYLNKLIGEPILKLKGSNMLDISCTCLLDNDLLLVGAMEGLYAMCLSEKCRNPDVSSCKVNGIEKVYQITLVKDIGVLVLICGDDRNLMLVKMDAFNTSYNDKVPLTCEKVAGTDHCHLVSVQDIVGVSSPHLFAATDNAVTLFLWDSSTQTFVKRKAVATPEPCSCIHFTQSSVIFGCDRFYELDLKTCAIEEFLDCTDPSLAGVVYGVTQLKSFPVSIFHVAATNQPEEYLVCFHELGVFVDGFGQRTRPDDLKWSRLPLDFAYRAPFLFMTHFNSLEVMEILPCDTEGRGVQGVVMLNAPLCLGPGVASGSIFVSSSHDQYTEVLSVQGSCAQPAEASIEDDAKADDVSPKANSSDPDDEANMDFSFSNSLLESLDTPSCDNLSLTSYETASS